LLQKTKNEQLLDKIRPKMQCIVTSSKQASDLYELKLEEKGERLRITEVNDIRKNKLKYSIKKHAHKVPPKIVQKINSTLWCVFGR